MKLDIAFVTYNSSKWIDACIASILKSTFDLKNVTLIFYDNNSTDNTIELLNKVSSKYKNKFNDIIVVEGKKNKGFGYGNNMAAKYGNSPYILFLNVDTEIKSDTLEKLSKSIESSSNDVGIWELSQRPYEHPKYYDPITGETSWASGACMVVRRNVFEKIKGFDKRIFMYCEDVEISWNVRKHGYKIIYLFDNCITHYSYSSANEFKYTQFVYAFISNWYIRAKYGSLRNYLKGTYLMFQAGFKGRYVPKDKPTDVQKKIKRTIRGSFFKHIIRNTCINLFNSKGNFKPRFVNNLDYEVTKENGFYIQPDYEAKSLVSIIVRTCNRPDALRENLISIRNQTYKNIEVVVVEDGKPTSEEMIKKEFKDLNINYEATGKNVGRSAVANIAMKKAKGKYLNFLDDDDVFFPDHVETLVKVIEKNNYDVVYDGSFETQINVTNKNPYRYEVVKKGQFTSIPFDRKKLYKFNLFPIQTVMFKKSLVDECGGIDESIDSLEDWDFWIRLSLHHFFYQVKHTTSIFRTPANKAEREKRQEFLDNTFEYLEEKFKTYTPDNTVYDMYKGD